MAYSREELLARYSSPEMQKALTIGCPGVAANDPMLAAFVKAADLTGLDVKTANRFLAHFIEEAKIVQAQALTGAK